MAQNKSVAIPQERYTRVDFTALRFRFNGIGWDQVTSLYDESYLDEMNLSEADIPMRLTRLMDALIEKARYSNPNIVPIVEMARASGKWSKALVEFIFQASLDQRAEPLKEDSVALWLKKNVAGVLRQEGIHTLGHLIKRMEKGGGWFRPIPRIGAGKAAALENWVHAHASSLGSVSIPKDDTQRDAVVVLGNEHKAVPLSRIAEIKHSLDGSSGLNRNTKFSLIAARTDLDAVHAYLYKFRDKPHAFRAYEKELERFLLWAVLQKGIPLSSVLTEECEEYKDFIRAPNEDWVGPRVPKSSSRWKPFSGALSPASQKYTVGVLRTFFDWLVDVRYLNGNPWRTVSDPVVAIKEYSMDIDKAIPKALWDSLTEPGGVVDQMSLDSYWEERVAALRGLTPSEMAKQMRLARAATYLMGFSGIRREEAANAKRKHLKPVIEQAHLGDDAIWEMAVLGKRQKWRTIYLPPKAIEALKAHWSDRGACFNNGNQEMHLLSPVVLKSLPNVLAKHVDSDTGAPTGLGFSPNALGQLIKTTFEKSLAYSTRLRKSEKEILAMVAAHALRHTFATHAAVEIPIDVVQRLLGHASQSTTAIYVKAERTRSIEEASKFFKTS